LSGFERPSGRAAAAPSASTSTIDVGVDALAGAAAGRWSAPSWLRR
jgi:hypothetical protein